MSDSLSGTFASSPQPEPSATIPLGKSAMLGRRHSSSFSSMEAQYRALPQSPDLAHDISIPSAIEDVDESILDDDLAPSSAPVDSRILWIHFMLGSAVLLPWNGTSETSHISYLVCRVSLTMRPVMITAEPYFLSRLRNSPIRSTFASYLATTFTLSNFIFLAHATVTSKKVCPRLSLTLPWSLNEWCRSLPLNGRDGLCFALLYSHVSSH
jgi:hypothetical protein